jgi:ribonuclease R
MPLRFQQRILDHLAHAGHRGAIARDIARVLRVPAEEKPIFHEAVEILRDEGLVEEDDRGYLRLPAAQADVTGRVRINQRGFGFLIPDTPLRSGDIFIPPHNLSDAVTGDRVRVKVMKERDRYRKGEGAPDYSQVGRVVEVIERGQARYTGVLRREKKQWLVEPDGKLLRDPVIVRDPHAKGAKEGDKVVIEIVHYPKGAYLAEGVITEVLGEAGKPTVETQAVIAAHGLRQRFPEEVVEQARQASRSFNEHDHSEYEDREDLRGVFTLTIDPPDAKDFDDAITIDYDKSKDEWTLGVHIADVSHFVKQDGALDQEAMARGNSVYLPRLVLPMLPEVLSNGVCSLQEGVPRLTKSAFITYNGTGKVLAQRLCSSVISSNKRLTYLEAQALIDGNEPEARKYARSESDYPKELVPTLRLMDKLARILRERRRRDGMIVLNLPEVELRFDDEGHVIDVVPEDQSFTHTLIEMFMVEANEAVARIFDDLTVPLIRRIHPDPAIGKMETLQMYAMVAGVRIPESPTRKDLQQLLEATRASSAARAIHFAVLRTLTKATYSPALIGHYALASDHYTHFTSPIRRYPDLSVHRAVQAYLDRTGNGRKVPGGRKRLQLGKDLMADDRVLDEEQLIELGRHCSETEVEAEEAERELRTFLVMQFLEENHLGAVFPGVVTGVTGGGVFVSIEQFLVEGLVKLSDLPAPLARQEERWRINERTGRLTGQKSGASIGLGDRVEVQIAAIDLGTRQMDLLIKRLPSREDRPHVSRASTPHSRRKVEAEGYKRRQKNRGGYKQGRRGRRGK